MTDDGKLRVGLLMAEIALRIHDVAVDAWPNDRNPIDIAARLRAIAADICELIDELPELDQPVAIIRALLDDFDAHGDYSNPDEHDARRAAAAQAMALARSSVASFAIGEDIAQ